jgi:hypothetical protein
MTPWETFASRLTGATATIYPAPPSQVATPAIVIRPDVPWIVPDSFAWDKEAYVAVCVVLASDPRSGMRDLYALVQAVMAATDDEFAFVEAGSPVIDETTGTPLLAATVRLTYRKCREETP